MLKEITTSANNHNREGINKALLCGTGNYIQHHVINQNVNENEKECIYVYIYMNHFAVQQKITQH